MNATSKPASRRNKSAAGSFFHAVVIGGSMTGLLAARALCDYFEHVTIIERDQFSKRPAPRKGVPQARHLHALLNRGLRILKCFFPGIQDELVAHGALVIDMANDMTWLTPAGWAINFDSGISIMGCSRDLLEWCVRRQLNALPQIRILGGCDMRGLIASDEPIRIQGVHVQRCHRACLAAAVRASNGLRDVSIGCRSPRGSQCALGDAVVD